MGIDRDEMSIQQDVDPAEQQASPSVWRYAMASRAHLVIDAADYFMYMRNAMLRARQRILLIGWDFDTRILIGDGRRWWNLPRRRISPARLGAFVVWLANRRRKLEIRVLKWNFGAFKAVFRGTMVFDLLRWLRHPRISFRLDSAHPLGCSHHQKIVVIDDRLAVCGGIDMAGERWDTTEHRENDRRRRLPGHRKGFPPWHDCTMLMEGAVAGALGEYGRTRWEQAGGKPMPPCRPQVASPWPYALDAEFENVEIGISRTRSQWGNNPEVREIEALFIEQIGRAKRFIYAENQYFASRKVAEAIALRLTEPDPPEIVLVMPLVSHGWLEQQAMDGARVRLAHAVAAKDHARRFSVWVPLNAAGTPIYVHSKLMIVDDEILRVGSANMNNRSMGLDSECDVFIDSARPANAHCPKVIQAIRHRLLAEHCGLAIGDVAERLESAGSMAAMIAEAGARGGRRLEPFQPRALTETEKVLADAEVLDPERPEEMLAFYRRGGLFKSRILRRPR
jgi:phosphatidylserine/phosphatidylglycerophosphate/cardiolipin synthase-like enzyme